MQLYFRQYKTILFKNLLINYRNKDFLIELGFLAVLILLIIVMSIFGRSDNLIPFYISFGLTNYSRLISFSIVEEKQNKQKELQKIMGCNSSIYLLSWLTYFLLVGIYNSIVLIIAFSVLGKLQNNNQMLEGLVPMYFLYMLGTFSFSLFLTTFFSNSKTAAQVITSVHIIQSFFVFFLFSQKISMINQLMRFLSFFPSFAFEIGFLVNQMETINFTKKQAYIFLSVDICLYFILFLYLEQVLKNQFGTQKHPLFFLKCLIPKNRNQQTQFIQEQDTEDESSAVYHQKKFQIENPLLRVINLSKQFQNIKAIKKISFNLYKGEIFCLLGHNGAGKTTTINILTGLIQPTSGDIYANGKSYKDNMQQIRKQIGIGFCLQQDVLYNELTVIQHLEYYCNLKGFQKQRMTAERDNIIQKCLLTDERSKLVKNLSGGNKRKLSLANAMIANSQILFLDQPSSGLDPNSRRIIWSILQQAQAQNRTIVLTTHHLQQAQVLSQRTCIMDHGNLLILGDNNYIKNHFGIGYHLTINLNKQKLKQKWLISYQIKQVIQTAKFDEQCPNNILKVILPSTQQHKFPQLFQRLQKLDLQFQLKNSSLEDAFINIGTNQYLNKDKDILQQAQIIQRPIEIKSKYEFTLQFKAIITKRFWLTIRSKGTILTLLLPIIFIITGTIIASLVFKYSTWKITSYFKFTIQTQIVSFFIVFAFIFNTAAYCGNLVQERQKKLRYLMNVLGTKKLSYWSANFTFDLVLFLVPIILFLAVLTIINYFENQLEFLVTKIGYLFIIFILFGISFIPFSYCFSFAFQKASTSYKYFPFINLFIFYLIPQIPMYAIPESALTKYIMPLISPFVALSYSFRSHQMSDLKNMQINKYFYNGPFKNLYYGPGIWYSFLILIIQSILYTLLLILLQRIRFQLKDRYTVQHQILQQHSDAYNQMTKVTKIIQDEQEKPIIVHELYKKYANGHIAIKNNSFSVEKGEIFGLLGPNGAGKSTIFNILTAFIPKTSGIFQLNNKDVTSNLIQQFIRAGICSQDSILYQNFTVQQHLKFFALIKGLNQEVTQKVVNYYLKIMSLQQYKNVYSNQLSGGNQRKLSVSIALLGNPQILFFDEPSSGLDPIGKRNLWNALNFSIKNQNNSIILTTHSMNEAQSLCNRIGILIKGKFICLGDIDYLKKKYGEGYYINIKLTQSSVRKEIEQFLDKKYIYKKFEIKQQNKITYQLSYSNKILFSEIFKLLFEQKQIGNILEFQISQCTLEQIFLLFSRDQPLQILDIEKSEPWTCCCFECGNQGFYLKL